MQCIIREPVDCGSPSQWLVINKIIGERWRRFLRFFLICMSFCTVFFMTSSLFFWAPLPTPTVATATLHLVESLMILCPAEGARWSATFKQRAPADTGRWGRGCQAACVHLYAPETQYLFSVFSVLPLCSSHLLFASFFPSHCFTQ